MADESAKSPLTRALPWFVLALTLACYLLLLDSPGTPDVPDYWLRWIGLMRSHGLVQGYALADSDYLPGAFICLKAIDRAGAVLGIGTFLALKCAIAGFAFVGALVFALWRRKAWQSLGFLAAIMLNSVGLAYLDTWYLPFLLLMLWSLQKNAYFWAGLWLGLSLSFKWQPLLIAPFVLIYVYGSTRPDASGMRRVLRLLGGIAPAVLLNYWLVGIQPLKNSFAAATSHGALSFQGLNLNWCLQMLLFHRPNPGVPYFAYGAPPGLMVALKGIFFAAYAILALRFWRGDKSYRQFLWFTFVGALSYFALNVGVHENHLFVAMIMAFCLLHTGSPLASTVCLCTALSTNLNLVLFYGLQGRSPLASALIDPGSVGIALANMIFFAFCFVYVIKSPSTHIRE